MTTKIDAFLKSSEEFRQADLITHVPQLPIGYQLYDEYDQTRPVTNVHGFDNDIWWRVVTAYQYNNGYIKAQFLQIRRSLTEEWQTIWDSVSNPGDGKLFIDNNSVQYQWGDNDAIQAAPNVGQTPPIFYVNGLWIIVFYSKTVHADINIWDPANASTINTPLTIKFKISEDNLSSLSSPITFNSNVETSNTILYGFINDIKFINNKYTILYQYVNKNPNPYYNYGYYIYYNFYEKLSICTSDDITTGNFINVIKFDPSSSIDQSETNSGRYRTVAMPITKFLIQNNKLILFVFEAKEKTSSAANYSSPDDFIEYKTKYLEVDLSANPVVWTSAIEINGSLLPCSINFIYNIDARYDQNYNDYIYYIVGRLGIMTQFFHNPANLPLLFQNYYNEYVFESSPSGLEVSNPDWLGYWLNNGGLAQYNSNSTIRTSTSYTYVMPKNRPLTYSEKGIIISSGNRWIKYYLVPIQENTNIMNTGQGSYFNKFKFKISENDDIFSDYTDINFPPSTEPFQIIIDWYELEDCFIFGGLDKNPDLVNPIIKIWKVAKDFSSWQEIDNNIINSSFYFIKFNNQVHLISLFGKSELIPNSQYYSIFIYSLDYVESEYIENTWISDSLNFANSMSSNYLILNDINYSNNLWVASGGKPLDLTNLEYYFYDIHFANNTFVAVGEGYDQLGYWRPIIAFKSNTDTLWTIQMFYNEIEYTSTSTDVIEGAFYDVYHDGTQWILSAEMWVPTNPLNANDPWDYRLIYWTATNPSINLSNWTLHTPLDENENPFPSNVWVGDLLFVNGQYYSRQNAAQLYNASSLEGPWTSLIDFSNEGWSYFKFVYALNTWIVAGYGWNWPDTINHKIFTNNSDFTAGWTLTSSPDFSTYPNTYRIGDIIFDGANVVIGYLRAWNSPPTAAGESFLFVYSSNPSVPSSWNTSSLVSFPNKIYALNQFVYANGVYAVMGFDDTNDYDALIIKSNSLEGPWTLSTNNSLSSISQSEIYSASYNNGTWVMVGYGSELDDNWSPASGFFYQSANNLNSFDIVEKVPSLNQFNPILFYKSSANLLWNSEVLNINAYFSSIKYANGYWVIAGLNEGKAAVFYTSSSTPTSLSSSLLGINNIVESRSSVDFDGLNWAIVVYNETTSLSKIFTTINPAITWTEINTPYHIVLLGYHNNKWVAVGYNTNNELLFLTTTNINGTWTEAYNFSINFTNEIGYPQDLIWDGIRTIVVTEKRVFYNLSSISWTSNSPTLSASQKLTSLYFDYNNPKYVLIGNENDMESNKIPLIFEAASISSNWFMPDLLFVNDFAELAAVNSDLNGNWFAVGESKMNSYTTSNYSFIAKRFVENNGGGGGGGGTNSLEPPLMVENFEDTTVVSSYDLTKIDRPDAPRNPSLVSGRAAEKFVAPLRIKFQWDAPDEDKTLYLNDEDEGLAPGQSEVAKYFVVVQRKLPPSQGNTWPAINSLNPTLTSGVDSGYTQHLYYWYHLPQHDPLDKAAALRNHRAIIWSVDTDGTFSSNYFNTNGTVKGQSGLEIVKTFTINGVLDTKKYETAFVAHRNLKITEITARLDGPPQGGETRIQLLNFANDNDSNPIRILSLEDRLKIQAGNHKPTGGTGASGAQLENDEIDNPYFDKGRHLFIKITAPAATTYLGDNLTVVVVMEPVTE